LNQFYLKKLKTIPNAEYKGQDKVYWGAAPKKHSLGLRLKSRICTSQYNQLATRKMVVAWPRHIEE
jgi:hypothetical protein